MTTDGASGSPPVTDRDLYAIRNLLWAAGGNLSWDALIAAAVPFGRRAGLSEGDYADVLRRVLVANPGGQPGEAPPAAALPYPEVTKSGGL